MKLSSHTWKEIGVHANNVYVNAYSIRIETVTAPLSKSIQGNYSQ